jgi:hypothetical protein
MVLQIPATGLQLESTGSSSKLPQQAFAITLDDSVIENMIQCVQNGKNIQLSLGSSPVSITAAKRCRTYELEVTDNLTCPVLIVRCTMCTINSRSNATQLELPSLHLFLFMFKKLQSMIITLH